MMQINCAFYNLKKLPARAKKTTVFHNFMQFQHIAATHRAVKNVDLHSNENEIIIPFLACGMESFQNILLLGSSDVDGYF